MASPAVPELNPFILALPKAELHLHLEGAIEPETLVELARNHGKALDAADLARLYSYSDFTGFLLSFRAITEYLETPEDYELVTYRLMQGLAAENVKHAEVYIAVGTCLYWGRSFESIFEGLERGRLRGERDFGLSLYWIFDAVRHFGAEAAQCVAERAVKFRERGSVVGFGIGGDERRAAPELFREVYAYASKHGLRLTCHAGETVGAHSIWGALHTLRAERIGHGLTTHEDPELVGYLLDAQVPIEVSVTSNVRTGCCAQLEAHPVKRYFDAGLMITLNTDDPAMFATSIGREYQIAQDVFGFTDEQLKRLAMNSFRASFLPEDEKKRYLKLFASVPVAHGD